MIKKITLPKLGQTVEEATIEKWHKQEGDTVAKGDVLCEITTDKATLEVESFYSGTLLKILAPEGEELAVGALIAVVGDAGDEVPEDMLVEGGVAPAEGVPVEAAEAASDKAAAPEAGPVAAGTAGGRIKSSPRARRLARERKVNLDTIRGTGPDGRIVEADVEAALAAASGVKATPLAHRLAAARGVDLASVRPSGPGGKITKEDVLSAAAGAADAGEVSPLSAMRRIIAERMLQSKRTIPCCYLEMDADVTDLVALRAKLNAEGEPKIGFNDFVIKACAGALRLFSAVNSRRVEGGIERRREVNVGFAVALNEGLLVPVVRDADKKLLREIAAETADLVERARSKRLRPEEYQDGCMTISNLGMFGVRSFIPIVNPGESTVLGLGLIEERVVSRQGKIEVRQIMTLTLSADHRLVDGAVGARFLETIRDALEAPAQLAEG
ncbi:MAG: dihydrolipoamide acetyltransferase family protein [Phycisphaerae bacterium]